MQKQKLICTIFFAKPLSQSLFLHLHQSLYKEGLPLPSPLTSKLGKVGTFADTRYLATNNGCQQQIWRYYSFFSFEPRSRFEDICVQAIGTIFGGRQLQPHKSLLSTILHPHSFKLEQCHPGFCVLIFDANTEWEN